jgi:uncharacterized protein (DUF58 family)
MKPAFAALGRSAGIHRHPPIDTGDTGVYATVADLASFEAAARDFGFVRNQPARSVLAGRHGSRIHGRGLAFDELRRYLPGDDIRSMDWRVTARTGKPHVRVFTEERDRPTLIIVDQRINMFFGSVRAMKSVAAAEVAALCAWRVLGQGDRVGALVFNDTRIDRFRPARSHGAVMRILGAIATQNAELHAESGTARTSPQLDVALEAAAATEPHDNLVIVISDFDGHGVGTRRLLSQLAGRNDVVAALVYDPFLLKLPKSGEIVVSDGELQIEIGFADTSLRRNLADMADEQAEEILRWRREIGVPVLPISAAEDTATQIRRMLGQAAERRR